MGARSSAGFTIIETMLFLAVTGLLIMGALIGAGASLTNQRYKDAVETFKNLVQTQYAELGSVKNDRDNTWACGSDAKPVEGTEFRGQSECLIVGRYVAVDGKDISIYTVVAHEKSGAAPLATDIATLKDNYFYNVAPDIETHTMEWGTQIAWPTKGSGSRTGSETPRSLGILIMRSPESGRIYTFTGDTIPSGLPAVNSQLFTDMMVAGEYIPGQSGRTICIQGGGGAFGEDTSVYIQPRAAGASAVEVRSNSYTLSIGGDTQC